MTDLSDYTPLQQKIIKEIVEFDNGFHSSYLIADTPFYEMLEETDNGIISTKKNVSASLSTGSTEYELQLFYSEEQSCWFYSLTHLGEEVRGVVHYNTVFNAMGEIAFVILNDNVNDTDLSMSLPYSNILILRK